MFNPAYTDWCRKRLKMIIDHYGQKFFKGKRVLDLGAGRGEIAAGIARMGAVVLAVDARQENIDYMEKHYAHIKTLKLDLENEWVFNESFDLVLSMGLLCHLKNYENHIKNLCSISEHIVIETEVLNSHDPNIRVPIYEEKSINDLSFSGEGSIVSSNNIQTRLSNLGATYKRVDETKLNSGAFTYDWHENGAGRKFGNRRLWFIRMNKFIARKLEIQEKEADVISSFPSLFTNNNLSEQPKEISIANPIIAQPYQQQEIIVAEPIKPKKQKIRLFYNYYEESDSERKKEIDFCLNKNIDNNLFELIIIESEKNPTYNFFFEKINILSSDDDINIICNSDIFFDQTISLASNINYKEVYALSRWEWYNEKSASLRDLNSSQDTWIFRGKVQGVNGNFQIGKPLCDNRIAYEFNSAGYSVRNPSKSIKTYHFHNSNIRTYTNDEKIFGPTLLVETSTL